MPDPDQTDSNDDESVSARSVPESTPAAAENSPTTEPRLKPSLLWLLSGLVIAVVIGLLFGFLPTRFRLLGLLAIGQGCAVGLLLGRAAVPLKMHYQRVGALGGFACGVASVAVTATLWWMGWAAQMKMPEQPRPDAALAAQMLAQMEKPVDGDAEQLKAYEETRRQMAEFLEQQTAPPKVELDDWLAHRASAVTDNRVVATLIGLIELLLVGLSAGWLARSTVGSPFCSTCQTWRRVIRSHIFLSPVPEPLKLLNSSSAEESIAVISAELLACGCDARPVVNLAIETTDGKSPRQLIAAELSDKQFADLKRLLDEAQGMK
jgi:F0F1-type ATP synthase assembly protein I